MGRTDGFKAGEQAAAKKQRVAKARGGGGTKNCPQRRRLRRRPAVDETEERMQKVSPGAELELKAVADRAGWLPCHIQLGKWVRSRGHTAGHTSLIFHHLSNVQHLGSCQ